MTWKVLDCSLYCTFFTLLSYLLVACENNLPQENVSFNTQELSCDTVSFYPYLFQGEFFLKNGSIVMIDPKNAGKMHILNVITGQTEHFSMKDSIEYPEVLLQQLPLSFFQFDMRSYYMYAFEKNKLKLTRQSFQFKETVITRAVQLGKNQYAALGWFREGLFGIYNNKSRKIKYYGHYPLSVNIPFDRISRNKIVQSFQGNIAYSAKHSKLIYCSRGFAYMACYKFTGSNLKFEWERHIIPPPEFSVVDGLLECEYQERRGKFSSVTTAGDYIFTSYSQQNAGDSISEKNHQILVHTMKGDHIATFYTDFPLSSIAVNLEERTIYGILYEIDPVVCRFQFKDIN